MRVTVLKPNKLPHFVKKKVAAYARVSVYNNLAEHSLINQITTYKDCIEARPDWEFAGVFADEGITGTKKQRPGFKALLEACEQKKVDIILVKSISRFARNTVDLLNTLRHLKSLGISVRFERENIDSLTEGGELLITLLASFAQEESRSASENMKWAIRKKFQQGIPNQFVLYGYKWNGTDFEVVPQQAEVVKQIFSDYLDGMTPHQIVRKLNSRDIPSTRGKAFSYSLVWDILRLEKYRGDSMFQKTYRENHLTKRKKLNHGELPMFYAEDTHPQIIDDETFGAVQEETRKRAKLGHLANQSISFSCFTSKLFCENCGRTFRKRMKGMKGRATKSYKWVCGNKIEHTSSFCNAQNVPHKVLLGLTGEVLEKPDFSDELFNSRIEGIIVKRPNTLIFEMKDKTQIVKTWTDRATKKE